MRQILASCILTIGLTATNAFAAQSSGYSLTIENHGFEPASLTVPAGKRIKIEVTNARALPSEFESFDLNREKVVPGGITVSVWIGPLKPGKYKFFDDFNPGVTGHIVVVKPKADPQP